MSKLFNLDNPIWRFMGRVTDLCALTVLWAIFSLPIITIGASTTALYYVSLKVVNHTEEYLWRSFRKEFKENFKQSTIIWMIMLILGFFLSVDLYIYHEIQSQTAVFLFWVFLVLTALYAFMLTIIFPLSSRLQTSIKNIFYIAFMVYLKNISWVILMTVITVCVVAIGLFVMWPVLFIGAGGVAFVHSKILQEVIYPKYNWNEIVE